MAEDDKSKHLRCRAIIELLGKPKEHIEKTIRAYVKKIKEDQENYVVLNESFAEIMQHEDMWTTFAEIEMVVKGLNNLVGFCLEYMPASIEVLKPESLKITSAEATAFFTDLQGKLHEVDMVAKNLRAENELLKRSMSILMGNVIVVSLARGQANEEILAKSTGIHINELKPILDSLVKEKKIKKEDELYSLA